jgi:hypothetical protein
MPDELRKLAMELAEPIQEAAARLIEMYLKEAISVKNTRLRRLKDLLRRADMRLCEHGDTSTHPLRIEIYDSLRDRAAQ